MGYKKSTADDVDSLIPEEFGGMWMFRNSLETEAIGLSVMELEPGGKNKVHDHAGDGQEEVYCVVDGEVTVTVDNERVFLGENEALRVDPGDTRQVENTGEERARLVIAGAGRPPQ
ncbi:cupin domain-containing protein [Haladaptatus sp. GCM10025707]|uniref:cupin domain-containing protein n=1 Tax=unclassified Haladaptatus TaxID=2622732 RepID=UPI0023E8D427|nr:MULTISPECIES: cupin domain-containing protein [unclassified Haladaptatus]